MNFSLFEGTLLYYHKSPRFFLHCSLDIKIYSSLNAAFELAISENIIDKNPLNDKTVLKPKSNKPDKKVRGFTQEEQQKWYEAYLHLDNDLQASVSYFTNDRNEDGRNKRPDFK